MLSEYAIQNITRTLKASQEYSENDDLGEFLKLLDGARWRKYPNEMPQKLQRILVSIDNEIKPFIVEFNHNSWKNYQYATLHWLPVPEVEK